MPTPINAPVSRDPAARLAERQKWITPIAQVRAQATIASALGALGGERLRTALHGDWLNEPLHAVITDIPVGAWTAAAAFDALGALSGNASLDTAADASVVLGLVGAVGAAITGMNDWAEVKEAAPRRIGAVHALLNVAATGFYLGSTVLRWGASTGSRRTSARALGILGFLLASASAHLGGNLVYEHGVGVAPRGGAAAMRRARRKGVPEDAPAELRAL